MLLLAPPAPARVRLQQLRHEQVRDLRLDARVGGGRHLHGELVLARHPLAARDDVPLERAARARRVGVTQVLLLRGPAANLEARTTRRLRHQPLHLAALHELERVAQVLLLENARQNLQVPVRQLGSARLRARGSDLLEDRVRHGDRLERDERGAEPERAGGALDRAWGGDPGGGRVHRVRRRDATETRARARVCARSQMFRIQKVLVHSHPPTARTTIISAWSPRFCICARRARGRC